jgi:CIC family chloride channel protein
MAAVFAGATRAPITAGIILFELTGEYTIILPLLLAVIVATGISRLLSRDTIYTRKLSRRGVDLIAPALPALQGATVSALMSPPPSSIPGSQNARDAIARLAASHRRAAPVVGEDGSLIGVLTAADAAQALATDDEAISRTAAELSERITALATDDHVSDVLDRVIGAEATDGVPVVLDGSLVGWLAPADVLRAVAS